MSDFRRSFPVSRRARSTALKPSPSGHRRYTPVPGKRRSSKQHSRCSNCKTLERCKSEPCILKIGVIDFDDDLGRDVTAPSLEILLRPQTCSDIFWSPDYHNSGSPQSFQVLFFQKLGKGIFVVRSVYQKDCFICLRYIFVDISLFEVLLVYIFLSIFILFEFSLENDFFFLKN